MLLWVVIGVAACLILVPATMKVLDTRKASKGLTSGVAGTTAGSYRPDNHVVTPPEIRIESSSPPADAIESLRNPPADMRDMQDEAYKITSNLNINQPVPSPPAALHLDISVLPQNALWSFGKIGQPPYTTDFRLLPDGMIGGYTNPNEHSWQVEPGKLTILNDAGEPTTVFDQINVDADGRMILVGQFVAAPDSGIEHYLETIAATGVSQPAVNGRLPG